MSIGQQSEPIHRYNRRDCGTPTKKRLSGLNELRLSGLNKLRLSGSNEWRLSGSNEWRL